MVVDFKAWFENPLKREESALSAPSAQQRKEESAVFVPFRLQSYHKMQDLTSKVDKIFTTTLILAFY